MVVEFRMAEDEVVEDESQSTSNPLSEIDDTCNNELVASTSLAFDLSCARALSRSRFLVRVPASAESGWSLAPTQIEGSFLPQGPKENDALHIEYILRYNDGSRCVKKSTCYPPSQVIWATIVDQVTRVCLSGSR